MIKIGPKYAKLKISLQLAITRLKYLQSKKLELSEKEKLEAIKCIQHGKYMQARIKAQRIIRNEATVEAMELIEMYCDQLLERYDLFQLMREPDDSLITTISSLIWVAPHYQTYIEELKVVMKQLTVKYGNHFCRMALTNQNGNVNPELVERVKLFMPTDEKIEICLKDICLKYNVDYKENRVDYKVKGLDNQKDFDLLSHEDKLNENTEFQARGIQTIDNSISSKKAFTEIMSKFKIKKSKKKKSDENKEASSINAIPTSSSETQIDENNSSNKRVTESDDSDVRSESFLYPPISEIGELEKNTFNSSKNEINNDQNANFSSSTPMFSSNHNLIYTEPPPPYNYLYSDGIHNEAKGQLCSYLNTFQYPSCPSYPELPDSPP